jgi:hypothetical protein
MSGNQGLALHLYKVRLVPKYASGKYFMPLYQYSRPMLTGLRITVVALVWVLHDYRKSKSSTWVRLIIQHSQYSYHIGRRGILLIIAS